jgi:predicted Zn-dependent peptidase
MLDRKIAPPFQKSTSFNLLSPEEKALENGIHLYFIAGGFQDVIKVEVVIEAGRWFEEKPGAAHFTAQLLSKGTKTKSSFEIAGILDRYGAHLEVNPGLDFVSISLYALSKNLPPVLSVLMEILCEPTFSEKEFQQTTSVFIQNLKVNNEKTSFLSSKLFRKTLYGESHPYGYELEEADVVALETRDLKKHFSEFFGSMKVFVSGKFDAGTRNLLVKSFAAVTRGQRSNTSDHSIQSRPENQYVKKDESIQSSVRMGRRSILRSHPDYVPVLFVSHILGGYFGSRLMKNIREEKGLTYGISASIHGLKRDSYLVIGADVNKENVALTFEEVRKELKILRTIHISSSELETTRNHFIGSLQSEITTPFAHADKIKTIVLYDLARDHYQKMITRMEKIDARNIIEISEQYFNESTFFEVAVG